MLPFIIEPSISSSFFNLVSEKETGFLFRVEVGSEEALCLQFIAEFFKNQNENNVWFLLPSISIQFYHKEKRRYQMWLFALSQELNLGT
jgi:hypothetical protein